MKSKSVLLKIQTALFLAVILLVFAGCDEPDPDQDTYGSVETGTEWLETELSSETEPTSAYRESADDTEFSATDPALIAEQEGQAFWNMVLFETIELLNTREDLSFTPSETALQEMHDYLAEISPKVLKNQDERILRAQYISLYNAMYIMNRSESEVYTSAGRALQFSESLIADQEDLFRMAEDDFEDVFGSQPVSVMFAPLFESYEYGFVTRVTERTEPGNHAVLLVYPDSGEPAWSVYFVRNSARSSWKIENHGY